MKPLALRGGESGKCIVPGRGKESLLIQRVLGLGAPPEERMPLKAHPLSASQIDLLQTWIDQGATWPETLVPADIKAETHWAYQKPIRKAPPQVKDTKRIVNPIDQFILARLEKEGLAFSPEAPREILLRRMSLDTTGLPPSVREVDEFVSDKSPNAYEKAVERLLESPHYGERWALPWLDLARYADTQGYEKDNRRQIWKYRDWVINALNQDMPYSQFTVEQIAGDLIPNATIDQKIATGFHRNTMRNEEGGVDRDEARWETIIDRVNTTASVWLGTTLACAQCHNHKYDPFTQNDYYRMFAFFENSDEPTLVAPTLEQQAKVQALENDIDGVERILKTQTAVLTDGQVKWEAENIQTRVDWKLLAPESYRSQSGSLLSLQDDGSLLAGGSLPARDTYIVTAKTDLKSITAFRLEVLPDGSLPNLGPGRAAHGNFVLTDFAVKRIAETEGGTGKTISQIALGRASADFSQEEWPVAGAIDERTESGWAIAEEYSQPHYAIFETSRALKSEGPSTLTFALAQHSLWPKHLIGRFRLWATGAKNPDGTPGIPENICEILSIPADEREDKARADIASFYRSIAPELQETREHLAQLQKLLQQKKDEFATTLVMQERATADPLSTHVRIRGGYLNQGEKVFAAVPSILHPLRPEEPANRLGLAHWLVDPENPLTARVAMNRLWEQYFGHGIVETSEDFGTQGERPVHPELLDWLATEFVRQGWSLKAMHRLILNSAAYRQSSDTSPALLEKDPYNRLLGRGPRFRLPAELLRDAALAISGQLSPAIGGPSVFPLQPEGIWSMPYNNDKWTPSTGESSHRRGLYTFWRRTSPYPAFTTFDAPSREFCCVRRPLTNTPLQAMTALNDPAHFELARALALRIFAESGGEKDAAANEDDRTAAQLTYGLRLCVSRVPKPAEIARLAALYKQELAHFKSDPKAAGEVVQGAKTPGGADVPQLAAMTLVANVLLNLDETLTKE